MNIFQTKINVSACTLENFWHIFSSVSGKLPPGKFPLWKFPPIKLSPGEFLPRKFPPGILSTMFLNISTRVFYLLFVFSLLSPLSLILVKRLLCNFNFKSVYVSEHLSKWSRKWRKAVNEMGGNIPGGNFLSENFPGLFFPGDFS